MTVATLAFGLSFFAYGAMLAPFLFVLFLSGIALGILGGGDCAAPGTGSRVVCVAYPGGLVAFRWRLLSSIYATEVDAPDIASTAAVVCL